MKSTLSSSSLTTLGSISQTSTRNILLAAFGIAALAVLIYHPLPDDFEQPWKYRFIKFNVELANIYVRHRNNNKKSQKNKLIFKKLILFKG